MNSLPSDSIEILIEDMNPVYVSLTIVHPEASSPCVIEGWLCRSDTQEHLLIQPSRVFDATGIQLAFPFSIVQSITPVEVINP